MCWINKKKKENNKIWRFNVIKYEIYGSVTKGYSRKYKNSDIKFRNKERGKTGWENHAFILLNFQTNALYIIFSFEKHWIYFVFPIFIFISISIVRRRFLFFFFNSPLLCVFHVFIPHENVNTNQKNLINFRGIWL